jgi:hypothetical protein
VQNGQLSVEQEKAGLSSNEQISRVSLHNYFTVFRPDISYNVCSAVYAIRVAATVQGCQSGQMDLTVNQAGYALRRFKSYPLHSSRERATKWRMQIWRKVLFWVLFGLSLFPFWKAHAAHMLAHVSQLGNKNLLQVNLSGGTWAVLTDSQGRETGFDPSDPSHEMTKQDIPLSEAYVASIYDIPLEGSDTTRTIAVECQRTTEYRLFVSHSTLERDGKSYTVTASFTTESGQKLSPQVFQGGMLSSTTKEFEIEVNPRVPSFSIRLKR